MNGPSVASSTKVGRGPFAPRTLEGPILIRSFIAFTILGRRSQSHTEKAAAKMLARTARSRSRSDARHAATKLDRKTRRPKARLITEPTKTIDRRIAVNLGTGGKPD